MFSIVIMQQDIRLSPPTLAKHIFKLAQKEQIDPKEIENISSAL